MVDFAVVFPGQGSQSPGMLVPLLDSNPLAREIFAEASAVLSMDIEKLVRNASAQELAQTWNSQITMLCAGYAVWRCLRQLKMPLPVYCAGHSLGEYTALCASGRLAFAAALQLVAQRARLMATHAPAGGCMAAVIGLNEEQASSCCAAAGDGVCVANINSASQIVLTGLEQAVAKAGELCLQAGARRVVPLPVSVPAHSPLLAPATTEFRTSLEQCEFMEGQCAILHNLDARSHSSTELPQLLTQHLVSPVRWCDTIDTMVAAEVSVILELGPGKVLAALCRRPGVKTMSVSTQEQMQQAMQLLQEGGN